jgi:hypothetical protein
MRATLWFISRYLDELVAAFELLTGGLPGSDRVHRYGFCGDPAHRAILQPASKVQIAEWQRLGQPAEAAAAAAAGAVVAGTGAVEAPPGAAGEGMGAGATPSGTPVKNHTATAVVNATTSMMMKNATAVSASTLFSQYKFYLAFENSVQVKYSRARVCVSATACVESHDQGSGGHPDDDLGCCCRLFCRSLMVVLACQ